MKYGGIEAMRDRLIERRHSVTNWPGFKHWPHRWGGRWDDETGRTIHFLKSKHKTRIACVWRKHSRIRQRVQAAHQRAMGQ